MSEDQQQQSNCSNSSSSSSVSSISVAPAKQSGTQGTTAQNNNNNKLTKDRIRPTVFSSEQPYKEVNPIKHIERRSIRKILSALNEEFNAQDHHHHRVPSSNTPQSAKNSLADRRFGRQIKGNENIQAGNSYAVGASQESYAKSTKNTKVIGVCEAVTNNANTSFTFGNKSDQNAENSRGESKDVQEKLRPGKRPAEEKMKENFYGGNNVTKIPSKERSFASVKSKGLGEFNQGMNIESVKVEAAIASQQNSNQGLRGKESKRRMFEGNAHNSETITVEMITSTANDSRRIVSAASSTGAANTNPNVLGMNTTCPGLRQGQRKTIAPPKPTIQDCFNDFNCAVVPQFDYGAIIAEATSTRSNANRRSSAANEERRLKVNQNSSVQVERGNGSRGNQVHVYNQRSSSSTMQDAMNHGIEYNKPLFNNPPPRITHQVYKYATSQKQSFYI